MGREAAVAIARWSALEDHPVRPVVAGVCDTDPERLAWFERIETAARLTVDHRELLTADEIDVVYIAVPHHMHEQLYLDAAAAGKDFLAEKPLGIDLAASERIVAAIERAGGIRALLQ
ncbi:MAG: Gfo/Idh/MocA family protein [Thermoleophilaceae bacterium]